MKICRVTKAECTFDCMIARLLDELTSGILIFDRDNKKVIYQNKRAMDIFESTAKPYEYETLAPLFFKENSNGNNEKQKDQNTIHYFSKLLGFSLSTIENNLTCVIVRDITEKKRLESIAEAVNISNNISYIFSGIRHEIGNPINSILVTMHVLKKNLSTFSSEEVQKYIDRTIIEASRVDFLLKSLKSFNIFESPNCQKLDIIEFLDRIIPMIKGDLDQKNIALNLVYQAKKAESFLDSRAIMQVVLNLISNAVDALEESDKPKITITITGNKKWVFLEIEDSGKGIPENDMQMLFSPFYTTKHKGTGLGLVMVRNMLAKMNSDIEIKSIKGKGTKVKITFPNYEHINGK